MPSILTLFSPLVLVVLLHLPLEVPPSDNHFILELLEKCIIHIVSEGSYERDICNHKVSLHMEGYSAIFFKIEQ